MDCSNPKSLAKQFGVRSAGLGCGSDVGGGRPVPGEEFVDAVDLVIGDAGQHVAQVGKRIDAGELSNIPPADRAAGRGWSPRSPGGVREPGADVSRSASFRVDAMLCRLVDIGGQQIIHRRQLLFDFSLDLAILADDRFQRIDHLLDMILKGSFQGLDG